MSIAPYNPAGMVASIPWNLIINKNNYELFLDESYNKFFQGSKWSGKSRHGAAEAVFELVNYPHRNVVVMKKNRTGASGHYRKTFKDIKGIIEEIDSHIPGFKNLWIIVDKNDETFGISYIGNWSDPKKQEILFASMDYDSTAGLKTGYPDVFFTKIIAEEIVDGNDDGELEQGHSSKYSEFKYFQKLQSNIFRFNKEEAERYNLRAQTLFTFNPWSMGHWLYLENIKHIDFYNKEMEKALRTKGVWTKKIKEYWYNEVKGVWTPAFFQINNWRTLLAENNQHNKQFISDEIIASITGVEDAATSRVLDLGLPSIPKGTILQGVLQNVKVKDVNFTDKMCVSVGIDIGGTDPYSLHFHWTTREVKITNDNKFIYTSTPTWKKMITAHEFYYDPLKAPISLSQQQIAEGMVNHIMTTDGRMKQLYGRSIFDNNLGCILLTIDNDNPEFVNWLEFVIGVKGLSERLLISKASNKNELDNQIPQRNTNAELLIGSGIVEFDESTTFNIRQHMPQWRMSPSGNGKMVHTVKHTYDSWYYSWMDYKYQYLPLLRNKINPNEIVT